MMKQRNQKKNMRSGSNSMRGKQSRKDNNTKRINLDNERVSTFDKDVDKIMDPKQMRRSANSNDVRWYALNDQLLRSAASLPFSEVVGAKMPGSDRSVPGVMQLNWVPFIGGNDNAVNQAANQIYSYTVHANSRNQSYDPSDEMLLILAGSQVFGAIANLLRVYGLMRRYDQMDYYTPSALVKACGIDFTDAQANYSKMWFDLNQLIAQSRQIWIPNTLPLVERWFWMNSNIYMDGASVKAQYYVFHQSVYYKYEETAVKSGGSLSPIVAPTTWDGAVAMVRELISALINSQDRGIIFGDILKAYGSDKIYSMGEIGSDYNLNIVYDREVLSQIENATVFPTEPSKVGGVYQDTNDDFRLFQLFRKTTVKPNQTTGAVSIPVTDTNSAPDKIVLNFHQLETPTPEQVMVATRLIAAGVATAGVDNDKNQYVMPATAGTEVLTAVVMMANVWTGGVPKLTEYTIPTNIGSRFEDSVAFNYGTLMTYMAFDWQPGIDMELRSEWNAPDYRPGASVYYPTFVGKILDYDLYTVVDATTLSKTHTTAVYSEFGVPSMQG